MAATAMGTEPLRLTPARFVLIVLLCGVALVWATPLTWMIVASAKDIPYGDQTAASLVPSAPTAQHFLDAWQQGAFPTWYLNTLVMCGGILAAQIVTIMLAGYAFARMDFRGKTVLFYAFLLQLTLAPA